MYTGPFSMYDTYMNRDEVIDILAAEQDNREMTQEELLDWADHIEDEYGFDDLAEQARRLADQL